MIFCSRFCFSFSKSLTIVFYFFSYSLIWASSFSIYVSKLLIALKLWRDRGTKWWSESSNLLIKTLMAFFVAFHFLSPRLLKTFSRAFSISFSNLSAFDFYIYFCLLSSIYFFLSDFCSSATFSTIFDFWFSITLLSLSFYVRNFLIYCSKFWSSLPDLSFSWTVRIKWSRLGFSVPIT